MTKAESVSETFCITNIPQTTDNVKYNIRTRTVTNPYTELCYQMLRKACDLDQFFGATQTTKNGHDLKESEFKDVN